jgi:hypothetical protein
VFLSNSEEILNYVDYGAKRYMSMFTKYEYQGPEKRMLRSLTVQFRLWPGKTEKRPKYLTKNSC